MGPPVARRLQASRRAIDEGGTVVTGDQPGATHGSRDPASGDDAVPRPTVQAGRPGLPPLIVIVGPTAVGKTDLSLLLARRLPAEIVSGDSVQVYRGLDIGTDKVPAEVRRRIRHHLIDIRQPDEPYSVADYVQDASAAIQDIRRRGLYPVLVGGTGLYVTALLYGYAFPPAAPDLALRRRLEEEYQRQGPEVLHRRLQAIDPPSAARIHPRDRKRLVRALEIWHQTGRRPSQVRQRRSKPRFDARCYGLTDDRERIYRAIEERVDRQLAEGLVDEVRRLLAAGYSPSLQALQALGYKQVVGYLQGRYDLDEARRRMIRDIRRFAKRQLTWYRHQMPDVRWFHRSTWSLPAIADFIAEEVAGGAGDHPAATAGGTGGARPGGGPGRNATPQGGRLPGS